MSKGNINVSVENIFPLIKKFLYSDHEIFLRELVSNATDATTKLKHLVAIGEAKVEYGNPIIEVKIDSDKKTLHIIDQGLGMTAEEVEKYINQIAFSGAEEFLEKYQDDKNDSGVIGHFGLGFYSAFMLDVRSVMLVSTGRSMETQDRYLFRELLRQPERRAPSINLFPMRWIVLHPNMPSRRRRLMAHKLSHRKQWVCSLVQRLFRCRSKTTCTMQQPNVWA